MALDITHKKLVAKCNGVILDAIRHRSLKHDSDRAFNIDSPEESARHKRDNPHHWLDTDKWSRLNLVDLIEVVADNASGLIQYETPLDIPMEGVPESLRLYLEYVIKLTILDLIKWSDVPRSLTKSEGYVALIKRVEEIKLMLQNS